MNDRPRILVVDDHPVNIAIVEELLRDEYIVESVESGEDAIEAAQRSKPDLVLLDVMLPEMDGYETCRRLRALPQLDQMPIIMLSAKAMEDDRQRGFEAGAIDYFTKPFDMDDLSARISGLLEP